MPKSYLSTTRAQQDISREKVYCDRCRSKLWTLINVDDYIRHLKEEIHFSGFIVAKSFGFNRKKKRLFGVEITNRTDQNH